MVALLLKEWRKLFYIQAVRDNMYYTSVKFSEILYVVYCRVIQWNNVSSVL